MPTRLGTRLGTTLGTELGAFGDVERITMQGAENWLTTAYFETAVGALAGDPAGFTISVLARYPNLTGANGRRVFAVRTNTTPGWALVCSQTSVQYICGTAASQGGTPTYNLTAGDVDKLTLFQGVLDGPGSVVRLYVNKAQVGTGGSMPAAFAPNATLRCMIGRQGNGNHATDITVYGVTYQLGVATLAQLQAQADAIKATQTMQAVPGIAGGTVIDFTQDLGGAGAWPATLVDRGTGGTNFSRIGAPAVSTRPLVGWGW